MKKTIMLIICIQVMAVCFLMPLAQAVDVGNSTGDSGSIPGSAQPGNAAYSAKQVSTMWKISVWVGKNDETAYNSAEVGIGDDRLSEDYYQFGSTFWLYRDTECLYYKKVIEGDFRSRFWIATANKEEYRDNASKLLAAGVYPGGKLDFRMSSADALMSKIYNGSLQGFDRSENGNGSVPYVRNIGSVTGYTDEDFDEEVDFFFNQSVNNWNILVGLAAKAAGYNTDTLLKKMCCEKKFTVSGVTVDDTAVVNPIRKIDENGEYAAETTRVGWVLMYEPVIIFYKQLSNGYNYYAMSVSDAAAAVISGCIALPPTEGTSGYTMITAIRNSKFAVPEQLRLALTSWNFSSPFFVNLAKSVTPKYSWFGYGPLESSDLNGNYTVSGSTKNYFLNIDDALQKAGVGLRYQGLKEDEKEYYSTVLIEKFVTESGDFENITFEITSETENFKDLDIKIEAFKLTGKGINEYSEVFYSGKHFVRLHYYYKNDDENNKWLVCEVTLPVKSPSEGSIRLKIEETDTPDKYDFTAVSTGGAYIERKLVRLSVSADKIYTVSFVNSLGTKLELTKEYYRNGVLSEDYSGIYFEIKGTDFYNKNMSFVFDGEGEIVSAEITNGAIYCPTGFQNGENPKSIYTCNCPSGLKVSIADLSAGGYKRIYTISGLPEGSYTIKEWFGTQKDADVCETGIFYKENAGKNVSVNVKLSCNSENIITFRNSSGDSQINLTITGVTPNASYKPGETVITSFIVENLSETVDVLPEHDVRVEFTVTAGERVIYTDSKSCVVPASEQNIIYFKWPVPEGINTEILVCGAEISCGEGVENINAASGTEICVKAESKEYSRTPDTQYESCVPKTAQINNDLPENVSQAAEWYEWVYNGKSFEKISYSVKIRLIGSISPCNNTSDKQIKSGYGLYLKCLANVEKSGTADVPADAYTEVQCVYVLLPEFGYVHSPDKYRTLEEVTEGSWALEKNEFAYKQDNVHFTPLWFPDGDYNVSFTATECWTPAGMIAGTASAGIEICGNAYEDWYIGRK